MASIAPRVADALAEAEGTLDNLMDVFDEDTFEMIQRIDAFIVEELNKLALNPEGVLISTEANIRRAINSRTALMNFATQEVTGLAEGWTASFDRVNDFVISNLNSYNIPAAFTEIDNEILGVLKSATLQDFASGTNFVFQDMGQDLMEQVLIGGDFRGLVSRIKNRLSEKLLAEGVDLATGRSLAAQAMRIGHDSLMSTYATMHLNKADEAGLEKFVYLGPRDKVTRSFCRERVDRIWKKEQIIEWNNLTWAGKISGVDVFIARGGYNCRHHFQAIPDAIDEEDLGLAKPNTAPDGTPIPPTSAAVEAAPGTTGAFFLDPKHIQRIETQDDMFEFARQYADWNPRSRDLGGITKTMIVNKSQTNGMMGMGKGNNRLFVINGDDFDIIGPNGNTLIFNPAKDLQSALNKITVTKKPLTYTEEYAINSFWHEMLHSQSRGLKKAGLDPGFLGIDYDFMEIVNEWRARRTYGKLMSELGANTAWETAILKESAGYKKYIDRLSAVQRQLKVTDADIFDIFVDININNTTNYYDDVAKALFDKSPVVKSILDKGVISEADLKKQINRLVARITGGLGDIDEFEEALIRKIELLELGEI